VKDREIAALCLAAMCAPYLIQMLVQALRRRRLTHKRARREAEK
jgi:hypothetical protein